MLTFEEIRELLDKERFSQAVAALAKQSVAHMPQGDLDEYEKLCARIPEEAQKQSAALCFGLLTCALRRGKPDIAQGYYAQLVAMRDNAREGTKERAAIACYTSCATMLMPQTGTDQLLLLLSVMHNDTIAYRQEPVRMSVTGRRPSVLRGTKDFSEWGRNYRAVASIVRPLLESISPGNAAGVIAAAVAELLYEKNDIAGASVEIASALSCGDAEVAFAGYAQLARISRLDAGPKKSSDEILRTLGELLEEKEAWQLMPNYRALRARFDMMAGRSDEVKQWLDQNSSDIVGAINPEDIYLLMTRAQALLTMGSYRDAVTLLERILLVLAPERCPMDRAECLVHTAIACEMMESRELALDKLEEALLLLAPYQYRRIIADGGKVAFQLLGHLMKDDSRRVRIPARYLQSVYDSAMSYSMQFPALFSNGKGGAQDDAPPAEELTASELQVLQLLSEGKSNKAIAAEINVQLSTVKFHISNIYSKLGVANRVESITKATSLGII